jgi:transglutaminase-like putative cysteine protease
VRRVEVQHVTEYRFSEAVQLLPHRFYLRPRESHIVRIASSKLVVTPTARLRWQRDPLDNSIALASFDGMSTSLRIESEIVVEHYDELPFDFLLDDNAVSHPFCYGQRDAVNLAPFLAPAWPGESQAIHGWLKEIDAGRGPSDTLALLGMINRSIARDFQYESRDAPGVQSPELTLTRRSGSCRDFAALMLEACRLLGFAARFVSGYQTSYEGQVGDGSTHAWAEVYLPGPGWKGFDPSSGLVTGNQHIAVAVAQHPEHVPPVSGSYFGPSAQAPTLHVTVRARTL